MEKLGIENCEIGIKGSGEDDIIGKLENDDRKNVWRCGRGMFLGYEVDGRRANDFLEYFW